MIQEDTYLGKWVKKGSDPASYALFGAIIAFLVTPVWDDFYKRKIAPIIDDFMENKWPKIKEKNLGLENIQIVDHKGKQIEIRLIGVRDKEEESFSSLRTYEATQLAIIEIESNFHGNDPIVRIVLFYDASINSYKLLRTEYNSSKTINHI